MKKVTVFMGSNRKGSTYDAVRQFGEALASRAAIDFEIVFLKEYELDYCRGCKLCFDRGEDCCPVKGDRDQLIAKIDESDGIIFAAPNYAFQVPAVMKNALDHLAFVFHRPRFFGKTYVHRDPGLFRRPAHRQVSGQYGPKPRFHPGEGMHTPDGARAPFRGRTQAE